MHDTNIPFLALVVLDRGKRLGVYGIEIATFTSAGNKQAQLLSRSATYNHIKQCRGEKIDLLRFVGLDKVCLL